MNTIFRKELYDVLRWTPLGMIVIGALCWLQIPGQLYGVRSVSSSIAAAVLVGSSLFALALGLLQSFFDLRTDSRAFLLHRPTETRSVFWGKLAAGFVAHCLAWAIPLLMAAIYLESMGPERLPVSWSNVVLAAACCITSFLFHPAGMWMACREARWVGTKCLPLTLPLIASIFVFAGDGAPIWVLGVFSFAWIVIAWIIIAAAMHAFVHQTFLPSPESEESWSWPVAIGLTAASVVTVVTVATFVVSSLTQHQYSLPLQARRMAVSASGQIWEIKETWKSPRQWNDQPVHRTGHPLTGDVKGDFFVELDETWQEQRLVSLTRLHIRWSYRYLYLSSSASSGRDVFLFLRAGRVYLYDGVRGWRGTVTPQGIFRPNESPQGTFRELQLLNSVGNRSNLSLAGHRILADENGIYQIDVDAWKLRQLTDTPATGMAIELPSDNDPEASLWSRHNGTLHRFSIAPRTKGESLPFTDSELMEATSSYPLANVEITPTGQWPMDWIDKPNETILSVSSVDEDSFVFFTQDKEGRRSYRIASSDGSLGELVELPPREIEGNLPIEVLMPPALVVARTVALGARIALSFPDWAWLMVALHALLGGIGAVLLARTRALSLRAQVLWAIIGLLTGIATWLAVIAIYARPVLEQCAACQRGRQVDTDRCAHCGADWESPDSEGIELIGPRGFVPATAQHEPV